MAKTTIPIELSSTPSIVDGGNATAITIDSSENVTFAGTIAGTLATAAQPNITSVGTLTSFRSTGIDDNADATAITIDSSERVGIGTTSPTRKLSILGTGSEYINIVGGTSSGVGLLLGDSDAEIRGALIYDNATDALGFRTGGNTERMRIDSSGNLLVGTTNTTFSNKGIRLYNYGSFEVVRPSDSCMELNRTGTDGIIARFHKDGSTVGSIGTEGTDLTIGSGGAGFQFLESENKIRPFNMSTNSASNGVVDLGRANAKFKDLYLSGAIKMDSDLDDYEEGTWTPAYSNGGSIAYTTQEGTYTKIGRLVHLNCKIDVDTVSGTNSGAMQITGAPFTNNGPDETGGSVGINLSGWLNSEGTDMIQINATDAAILPSKDTTNDIFRGTDIGTGFVCWSITYMTDQ